MPENHLPLAVRRWLTDALLLWQERGLLSEQQAAGIRELHQVELLEGQQRRETVSFALSALSVFLFGLAALLLVSFNWEALSRDLKLGLVLGLVAATHSWGIYLQPRFPAFSQIIFFLGCLFYGAGIWLIAQAFHLPAHYPSGVFWWAIGVLPFALLSNSLLLHAMFVGLMAIWTMMETVGSQGFRPVWAGGLLPMGVWTLPIWTVPGLIWAYRRVTPTGVGLYVALLTWWLCWQVLALNLSYPSLMLFWAGGFGALLLLIAETHRSNDPMAIPFRLCGTALTAGSLLPMGAWWYWTDTTYQVGWLFAPLRSEPWTTRLYTLAVFGLLGLAGFGVWRSQPNFQTGSNRQTWAPAGLLVLMLALTAWTAIIPFHRLTTLIPQVLANVAMVSLSIYLIHVGAREERFRPFAAGVLYFLIWAIVRYLDLFGAMGGMLGSAVVFTLCGVALLVLAKFWGRLPGSETTTTPTTATMATDSKRWTTPVWFTHFLDVCRARQRACLWGAMGLNLFWLVGMIGIESAPLLVGTTVVLRVEPVDPRDFFRGDYVILRYDISSMEPIDQGDWGQNVYVALEPLADSPAWQGVSASHQRPANGVYVAGQRIPGPWQRMRFGIEAFYVQEGQGRAWEQAAVQGNLLAEISVAPWGQAKLRRLVIDSTRPAQPSTSPSPPSSPASGEPQNPAAEENPAAAENPADEENPLYQTEPKILP